MYMDDMKWASS